MRSTCCSTTVAIVTVPEVISLRLHPVRCRDDFDEITSRNLNGRDFGHRETDQVSQHAADDGGVADDKQVFLFTFELDKHRFKTHWRMFEPYAT